MLQALFPAGNGAAGWFQEGVIILLKINRQDAQPLEMTIIGCCWQEADACSGC